MIEKRAPRFSEAERHVLIDGCLNRWDILESNVNSDRIVKVKECALRDIAKEVNAPYKNRLNFEIVNFQVNSQGMKFHSYAKEVPTTETQTEQSLNFLEDLIQHRIFLETDFCLPEKQCDEIMQNTRGLCDALFKNIRSDLRKNISSDILESFEESAKNYLEMFSYLCYTPSNYNSENHHLDVTNKSTLNIKQNLLSKSDGDVCNSPTCDIDSEPKKYETVLQPDPQNDKDYCCVNVEEIWVESCIVESNSGSCPTIEINSRSSTGEKSMKVLGNPGKGMPKACVYCGKVFNHAIQLDKHVRIHTDDKPYTCTLCQKSFSKFNSLLAHSRVHSEEILFQCNVCQKSFNSQHGKDRHLRKHVIKKTHDCPVCGKSFKMLSRLQAHSRFHSDERPYKCDQCDKSFAMKGDLARHNRIHTGEKPYKCDICDMAFSDSGSLPRHKRTHTITPKPPSKLSILVNSLMSQKHIPVATYKGRRK